MTHGICHFHRIFCAAIISDPPYYNSIPYADLADFYYVWLSRLFKNSKSSLFSQSLSPKDGEITEMAGWDAIRYPHKTKDWYEIEMARALEQCRSVLMPNGVMVLVFAHKETRAWEAFNFCCNKSWLDNNWFLANKYRKCKTAPCSEICNIRIINTFVCRPRESIDGTFLSNTVSDWRDVLQELPSRIHSWLPRLAKESVVGADAIFACLGPALEIYSRSSRVEKASGEQVSLSEYLEYVWAAVAREALEQFSKARMHQASRRMVA